MRQIAVIVVALALLAACGRSGETAASGNRIETLRHSDGSKAAEGGKRGDLRDGPWTFWDTKGAVISEGTYVDGVKEGRWLESLFDGDLGEWIRDRGTYLHGKRDGLWQTRAVSGWLVREVEWRDETMNGLYRADYPSGRPQYEGTHANNKRTGRWTYWYEDGTKEKAGEMVQDHHTGIWKAWYPDGKPGSEVDHATGQFTRWQLDGGIARGTDPQLITERTP